MQENEQARALSIHADSHIPFPLDTNPGHEVNYLTCPLDSLSLTACGEQHAKKNKRKKLTLTHILVTEFKSKKIKIWTEKKQKKKSH
jgi:hypothetical protein